MTILQVVTSLNPTGGGVAGAAVLLHRDFSSMGHSMELLSVDDPSSPWLDSCPQPCYAVGPGKSTYEFSRALSFWLEANIGRFDAAIVHGLWQHAGIAVRSACKKAGVAYFVYPHGMLDPWFKRSFPLKHLKKWLYWPWGEFRVLRDAAAVFFTCDEERRLARQSFSLYRCNERVTGLGLDEPAGDSDSQREQFFNKFSNLRGKRYFLFLGRLHPKKGIEMLLDAFGATALGHPDVELVIAGVPAGPGVTAAYRVLLEQKAKHRCPPGRVHFVGLMQGDLKWGALRAAEAFVLSSHQENFGIAVVEALATGSPVLISRQVNIWREIEEHGAGLVQHDTTEGTIALLDSWLAMLPELRLRYRARARACFQEHFEIRRVSESILSSVRECVAG